jgi:hypothetical protein
VLANVTAFTDTTPQLNMTYFYRVIADNLVGDTATYAVPAVGFPTVQAESTPSNTVSAIANSTQWYNIGDTVANTIAEADVNNDGQSDIVTGGYYFDGTRNVAQITVRSNATLVLEDEISWYWTDNTTINSIAIGDVNGDTNLDIVAGGSYFDGTRNVAQLTVWSGPTSALENVKAWYWTGNTVINSVAIGDVNGDTTLEIITGGTYNDGTRNVAQLAVWTGSTLALQNVKSWYWTDNTTINAVKVANTDADSAMEIITGGTYLDGAGASTGQIVTWTGSTLALETVSVWQSGTATYIKAVDSGSMGSISAGYFNDGTRLNAQIIIH